MGTKVITGKVRASYVNVFRPRQNNLSGTEEYSMMIIIPKDDEKTVDALKAAIKEAAQSKWPKPPKGLRSPLRDADAEAEAEGEDAAPHLVGCYFMNVKSKQKPQVVDRQRYEITEPSAFQSGDYCRVSLGAFAYDVNGNRGVSFGLNNVQVLAKGEPLGGGQARARDEFDDWEEDDDLDEDWAA